MQLSCQKSARIVVFRAWFGIPTGPRAGQLIAGSFPPVSCNSDDVNEGTISPSLHPSYYLRQGYEWKNGEWKKELSPSASAGLDQHHSKSFNNHYFTNCRLTQVTEAIVKECQGKRKCSLIVNKKSLSYTESGLSPLMTNCQESSPGQNPRARGGSLSNQLKIQYTCAPKHIFRNLPEKKLPPTKTLPSTEMLPSTEKLPPAEMLPPSEILSPSEILPPTEKLPPKKEDDLESADDTMDRINMINVPTCHVNVTCYCNADNIVKGKVTFVVFIIFVKVFFKSLIEI